MRTKQRENNFKLHLRRVLRRRGQRHDPMLVLNMSIFNQTDGWNRIFSKNNYARLEA